MSIFLETQDFFHSYSKSIENRCTCNSNSENLFKRWRYSCFHRVFIDGITCSCIWLIFNVLNILNISFNNSTVHSFTLNRHGERWRSFDMCREQVQDPSNQLWNSDNWRSRGRTDCRQCVYVQLHEQEIWSGKLEFRKMHEKPDTDMTELVIKSIFTGC